MSERDVFEASDFELRDAETEREDSFSDINEGDVHHLAKDQMRCAQQLYDALDRQFSSALPSSVTKFPRYETVPLNISPNTEVELFSNLISPA
uniref:Uncharacterized protein n=1 Tax=Ditylenchus dipsaci TaxID=166011 RepID=A0A915DAX8_9BILA